MSPETKVLVRVMICDDMDLRRLPLIEQSCVVTLTEHDPFKEHDKEDSKLALSLEEAVAASLQRISWLYCTDEITEILPGELARPHDGGIPFQAKDVFGPHMYIESGWFPKENAYPARQARIHKM